ncbi:hypothetical protein ACOJCM_10475 [Billgrantia sp. LNSP4103-1]|uniref:hypothetical protein n=1 Tax=Billgrantia sp. LNSP4103-1 TaxID=3410266 RepID=UPI00403F6582
MSSEFNLPGSSFEEVQKIIKGYSHAPDNASLDALAKLTGLHKTSISRNNKFLNDVGLITGGMKKSPTELGRRLGRALDHKQASDIEQYWAEAIKTNETVSGLVTTVRIKGGMSEKDFSDHVLYVSGQKNNAGNKTGARCVVDVLVTAKLLEERDGKLSVATPKDALVVETTKEPVPEQQQASGQQSSQESNIESIIPPIPRNVPQIAINIQLHLPETDNAEVYEKLFKALREQLISPKE